MNMISTVPFLAETDASTKQAELVKKLTTAWEKKNSKAARAGGVSLMALSLAACGGSDNTPFSQADIDTAVAAVDTTADDAAAILAAVKAVDASATTVAEVATNAAAAVDTSADDAAAILAAVQAVDATATTVAAVATNANAAGVASVDTTADDAAAISTALRDAAAGLGVTGTSTMTNAELITAIKTANDSAIAAAVDTSADDAAAVTAALKAAADDLGVTGTASMTDAQLITAIKTANDAAVEAAVDLTTNDTAAINAAVAADTSFATLAELVAAYDALANPTATGLTLTASTTDTASGDANDNTITGNQVTFDNTDTITGGDGTDTLAITNTAAGTYVPGLLSGVEIIQMTSYAGSSIDLVTATGVTNVVALNSTAADSFLNVQSLAGIKADGKTAGELTVEYKDSLAGATATASVELTNGSTISNLNVSGASNTEFGTIAVTSSGSSANTLTLIEDQAGSALGDLTTLTVSGSANTTIGTGTTAVAGNNTAADMTLNASDATGNLTVTGVNFENITLGSGDDTLYVGATQISATTTASQVVIDGGSGSNTLVFGEQDLSAAGLANQAVSTDDDSITNFQTLTFEAINSDAADTTDEDRAIDANAIAGVSTISIDMQNNEKTASDDDVSTTVSDLEAGMTVQISSYSLEKANADSDLILDMDAPSGTADAITLESIASSATTAHANIFTSVTVNQTSVSGTSESVETLNLNATRSDVSNAAGTQITTLAAGSTTTLDIGGAGGLTIGTVELSDSSTADTTVAVIDASDMTGNLTLGTSSADYQATDADDITLTLGSGTNTVYGGTALDAGDTITGGGTDTVHLTAGAGKVNLSDIDIVAIAGATATTSAENWSSIGYVDVTNGNNSTTLTNLANGTLIKSDDIDTGTTLNADLATGGTQITIELDTATASAGTFDTNATDLTINHTGVDTNSDYADNALILSSDVTSITLTGGGETSTAGTHSKFTLSNASGATVTSISSSYDGDLDVDAGSIFNAVSGATVTTGATTVAATTYANATDLTNGLVHFNDTGGTDTLAIASTTGATLGVINVDGYETFSLDDYNSGSAFSVNFRDSTGIERVQITGPTGGDLADNITLNNLASGSTIAIAGAYGDGADTLTATAATGSSDTVTITSNSANFVSGHADAAVTLSGFETVNIAGGADNVDLLNTNKDALLTLTGTTTLNIGGDLVAATDDGDVTTGTISGTSVATLTMTAEGGSNTVTTLGTMNSLETLTMTAATGEANTITAGTSTSIDTISISGAGSNTITALTAASLDTISGGSATGAITLGSSTAALSSASGATFTTGTGDDTITMSTQSSINLTAGELSTTDNDTLILVGAQNSGTGVIDLSATDQIVTLNGFADSAAQTQFESVNVDAITSTGSYGFQITTGTQASTVTGSDYNDTIIAGSGALSVSSGTGADTVTLGDAEDSVTLTGGTGSTVAGMGSNTITITNFSGGTDNLIFSETVYSDLSSGALGAANEALFGLLADTTTAMNTANSQLDGSGALDVTSADAIFFVGTNSAGNTLDIYFVEDDNVAANADIATAVAASDAVKIGEITLVDSALVLSDITTIA